jgi:YMGG-like Gly-zipper
MNSLLKTGAAVLMLSALAGCTNPNDPGQRAASGALIGAGSGAAIGAIAGGPVGAAIGAGVGAVAGAATGYATTPPPSRQEPYYPPAPAPAPSGY